MLLVCVDLSTTLFPSYITFHGLLKPQQSFSELVGLDVAVRSELLTGFESHLSVGLQIGASKFIGKLHYLKFRIHHHYIFAPAAAFWANI